ncbi:peptidyl-prolyl cis-trans isomerase [Streptomyces sp. DT2A-34]|uniref:peptidyl-prolyl cis-trans isomerase n=1 Tax=Streptomyces sp. DT2A-34 TaxID=3051182 RepID=UPI00265B95F4|nr:peptidyl-prolyl cis-trans isomerase [Streptomyces sp. DT2A-34]MDO0910848.1 peptidyl-prolyl cis-trans isomerase [Streptomyces sp. DT2A-34]
MTGEYAARVHGEAVRKERVDAFLEVVPPRNRETRPEALARAERQRRRWATQVVVTDELARRACAKRGLEPPEDGSAAPSRSAGGVDMRLRRVGATSHDGAADKRRPIAALPAERDVADLGSIVAAALAHSPAARLLLAELESEQHVPETAVRDYYDRNPDRFLTPAALRRGVDPFGATTTPADFLPYEHAREGIAHELRRTAGLRAFFDWLDQARTGVEYAPGHEHPGDPSHPDHEHRH